MVGARSIAFPRMNAFAWWVYLFGGLMLFVAFAVGSGPDVGWFSYVPLAEKLYSPTKRVDVWAQMITFTELSGLLQAVVIAATVIKLRAPGMTLARMPLLVWAMFVTAFMIMFAMPAVMLASTALILDRLVDTRFYDTTQGGDAVLWQHLFWFFGHPEVYFIFLPGLGFMSSIVATFARRPVVGYPAMVLALVATAFLSFGLWVHHMFATNLPELGKSFFTAASMMIAIPAGVQVACWLATLCTGRIVLRTPMLYALSFFVNLVLGGLTGVMLASVPLDLQVHDTYFVVAHLHYVLIGGAVFPLLGAVLFWFPKLAGRMPGERRSRVAFWLLFVGFNVTFFPMHLLGLAGMPRRVWTYQAGLGWEGLNLLSSAGAALLATGGALFLFDLWRSARTGAAAPPNPWGAATLEWATASPPPAANFDAIPVVHHRESLWAARGHPTHVGGLAVNAREVLLTTPMDADPDLRVTFPQPTIWPFVSALATTALFIGSMYNPWAIVWFSPPVALAMTLWFWPKRGDLRASLALERRP